MQMQITICAVRTGRGGSDADNTECDGRHLLGVSYLTETKVLPRYYSAVIHGMEAVMLVRTFVHLTTQAIVLAAVLMLALPFFLTLAMPFIGR
jgi:hypothetical protein